MIDRSSKVGRDSMITGGFVIGRGSKVSRGSVMIGGSMIVRGKERRVIEAGQIPVQRLVSKTMGVRSCLPCHHGDLRRWEGLVAES